MLPWWKDRGITPSKLISDIARCRALVYVVARSFLDYFCMLSAVECVKSSNLLEGTLPEGFKKLEDCSIHS